MKLYSNHNGFDTTVTHFWVRTLTPFTVRTSNDSIKPMRHHEIDCYYIFVTTRDYRLVRHLLGPLWREPQKELFVQPIDSSFSSFNVELLWN